MDRRILLFFNLAISLFLRGGRVLIVISPKPSAAQRSLRERNLQSHKRRRNEEVRRTLIFILSTQEWVCKSSLSIQLKLRRKKIQMRRMTERRPTTRRMKSTQKSWK